VVCGRVADGSGWDYYDAAMYFMKDLDFEPSLFLVALY
jgi:hypothetical protein